MAISLPELANLEHVLDNGTLLDAVDLVTIELFRMRVGDSRIRDVTGLSQNELIGRCYKLRQKLGCPLRETIREAADRLEIPRLPANGLTGKAG